MGSDNENFDNEFDKFEKQREFATAMTQIKSIYDAAVASGFTEAQALKIVSNMLMSGSK